MSCPSLRRLPVIDAGGALVGVPSADDMLDLLSEELYCLAAMMARGERYEREQRKAARRGASISSSVVPGRPFQVADAAARIHDVRAAAANGEIVGIERASCQIGLRLVDDRRARERYSRSRRRVKCEQP